MNLIDDFLRKNIANTETKINFTKNDLIHSGYFIRTSYSRTKKIVCLRVDDRLIIWNVIVNLLNTYGYIHIDFQVHQND
jgi:hypothetical protein